MGARGKSISYWWLVGGGLGETVTVEACTHRYQEEQRIQRLNERGK